MWPPLHHARLGYSKQLDVQLIYMRQALTRPTARDGRVDVAELRAALQAIAAPLGQSVNVVERTVLFSDCDHCVTAYSGCV